MPLKPPIKSLIERYGGRCDLAPVEGSDFYLVDAADPEEGVHKLVVIVQRFRLDPIRDIHVLCPMNRPLRLSRGSTV